MVKIDDIDPRRICPKCGNIMAEIIREVKVKHGTTIDKVLQCPACLTVPE